MTRKLTQTTIGLKEPKNGHGDKWGDHFALKSRGSVTWKDASPELLSSAIAAATEDGAALLLSKTQDGGALSIHVLTDGGTFKLYPASVGELQEGLQLIVKIGIS